MVKRLALINGIFIVIVLLGVASIQGCALGRYGSEGKSREEFAEYVEAVFKLQNRITSQIMLLTDSENMELQQSLLGAEQKMRDVCGPINEYAARDIDGVTIGLMLRHRVEKSVEDCDKAAQQVELLLNNI